MDTFEQIWSILPHPSPNHVIRLFARYPTGKVAGDFARNPDEIKRFAKGCEGANNYVCLNPTTRKDGIRHNADDTTHWSFLVFDIDPIGDDPKPDEALWFFLNTFGGLSGRNFEQHPPTIINSGRGMQAWLRGCDIELDVTTRKSVRRIMSYWLTKLSTRFGLVEGCKLDTSCSDLPRPMRLPGTTNIKTGKLATICNLQTDPYPWLFPFLIQSTPEEVTREREVIIVPGASWQSVYSRLTISSQRYLTEGWEEPGRHKVCYHTAKSLQELGIEREKARQAITWANKLKGDKQELKPVELDHAIESAYGKET